MTGWTWEHVAEHVDLPRLAQLRRHWRQFPPLPILVGHYLGAIKQEAPTEAPADPLAQDLIPAQRLPAADFDAALAALGLPTQASKDTP